MCEFYAMKCVIFMIFTSTCVYWLGSARTHSESIQMWKSEPSANFSVCQWLWLSFE